LRRGAVAHAEDAAVERCLLHLAEAATQERGVWLVPAPLEELLPRAAARGRKDDGGDDCHDETAHARQTPETLDALGYPAVRTNAQREASIGPAR